MSFFPTLRAARNQSTHARQEAFRIECEQLEERRLLDSGLQPNPSGGSGYWRNSPYNDYSFLAAASCNISPYPIRYMDGMIVLNETDLESHAFGTTSGHTRTWSPYANTSGDFVPANGNHWETVQRPHMLQDSASAVLLVDAGLTSHWFDWNETDQKFHPRLDEKLTLVHSSALPASDGITDPHYVLIHPDGTRTRYYDFQNATDRRRGQLIDHVEAGGLRTVAEYYTADTTTNTDHYDLLMRITRVAADGFTETFIYRYDSTRRLSSVEWAQGSSASVSQTSNTATATTNVPHGLTAGDMVTVMGAQPTEYNGTFTALTVGSSTTFTYTVTGNPASPATGEISAVRTVRKATYAYYGTGETNGASGDLKLVTIADEDDQTIDQKYYRYWTNSGTDDEHATYGLGETLQPTGGLQMVFGPQSFARLQGAPERTRAFSSIIRSGTIATATVPGHNLKSGDTVVISGATAPEYNGTFTITLDVGDPDNKFTYMVTGTPANQTSGTIYVQRPVERVQDGEAKKYADNYFAYNKSAHSYPSSPEQRVKKEVAQGAGCSCGAGGNGAGQGELNYQYYDNPTSNFETVDGQPNPHYNNPGLIEHDKWLRKVVEILPDDMNPETASYDPLANPPEFDDNDRNIYYLNEVGNILLKVFQEGVGDDQPKWMTFYEYDTMGRLVMTAQPSAVDSDVTLTTLESYPDLLNRQSDGTYQYLNDHAGIIEVTDYAPATSTISETAAGDVVGYERYTWIKHGDRNAQQSFVSLSNGGSGTTATAEVTAHGYQTGNVVVVAGASPAEYNGTFVVTRVDANHFTYTTATAPSGAASVGSAKVDRPVLQSATTYFQRTVNGASAFPVASRTIFAGDDQSGAQTTSYAYTWFSDNLQAQSVTTTLATVIAANNGPGTAVAARTVYDIHGRVIWTIDGDGYAHAIEYDHASGAVSKSVMDSDTPYPAYVLADGPVGYWRLGESTGPVADYSGNRRDGSRVGTPTVVSGLMTGDSNSAYSFASSGTSRADVADHASLDNAKLTVEAWVQLNAFPSGSDRRWLVNKWDSSTQSGFFLEAYSGGWRGWIGKGGGTAVSITSTYSNDTNPHHLAMTYDGSDLRLFVDGQERPTAVSTSGTVAATALSLQVGGWNGTVGADGTVDEVALYGSALPADRISAHYEAGRGTVAARVGLSLTTQITSDPLGRTTKLVDPNLHETYTVYRDAQHEVRTYPGWHAVSTNYDTTGPVLLRREDRAGSYTETLSFDLQPVATATPTGSESFTGAIQSLARTLTNIGGQTVKSDSYFSLANLSYSTASFELSGAQQNTHYHRLEYGYNAHGWKNKFINGAGTIRRTVYDGFGNVSSEWVGTNDTDAKHQDATGAGASSNNMVRVRDAGYDGAPAAPRLTSQAGGTSSAATYYVKIAYSNSAGTTMGPSSHAAKYAVGANHQLKVISPAATSGSFTHYHVYVATASGEEKLQTAGSPIAIGTDWTMTGSLVTNSARPFKRGGNGNVTQETLYPGPGLANRTTDYHYDWRDRLLAAKSGVEGSEGTDVNRPITYSEVDNLGHVTATSVYDGDSVGIVDTTPADGIPDKPAATKLRAYSTTFFDELRRPFLQRVHSVDASTGSISANSLLTSTWYDRRGNVMKVAQPGGVVTKHGYDGAGRSTDVFITDSLNDSTWTHASTVGTLNGDNADTVLEQTQTEYDKNGNVIRTVSKQRFHTATATGPLGGPATAPEARVSYADLYYDRLNRLTEVVNGGTNGGSAYTHPTTPDARSDTRLVTSYIYDGAGRLQEVKDPREVITRNEYDLLARVRATTEAYTSGSNGGLPDTSNPGVNRRTEYTYDGNNNVLTMKAVQSSTVFQTTQYVYGATTGSGGSDVNSNDLLGAVRYPIKSGLQAGEPSTSASDKQVFAYDALGGQKKSTDQNGTVHEHLYDVVGRPVTDKVTTFGTNVDQTVKRLDTRYDEGGRPYLFTSYSDTSGTTATNQVKREFNGLGQLTGEWQDHDSVVGASGGIASQRVQYTYSFDPSSGGANHSRLTGIVYPDGRVLSYGYDLYEKGMSAITRSGTTATATATGHGLVQGEAVVISGAAPAAYNGLFTVASVAADGNSFTYTLPADPGQNATGTAIRVKRRDLDEMTSRVSYLSDLNTLSPRLEKYSYLGAGTIVERSRPETRVGLTYVNDAGDQYTGVDSFGRVIDHRWRATDGSHTDRFKYSYDRTGNRLYKENVVSPTNSELYMGNDVLANEGYDKLGRLKTFKRGQLSVGSPNTNNGTLLDTVSSANPDEAWTLDALGNWTSVTGTTETANRTHNSRNELETRTTAAGTATLLYDNNGNMRKDENGKGLIYDPWNRLVGYDDNNDGDLLDLSDVTYAADALGRRIVIDPGSATANDLYYSSDWQVLEEREAGTLKSQNVWGLGYVDALVLRDYFTSTGGALDTTFDTDGHATTNFGGDDGAGGVAIQPDGKIVAAGYKDGNFAALRYNRDGSLDTTFSGDGKVDVPVTAGGQGYAMTLQADGKIIVVGFSNANSGDFALMRFNTDGTLDTSFDTDGIRTTDFGGTEDIIHAVAIDAQGRIVVSGRSGDPNIDIDYAVARYNPNGSLDTSFGTNGLVKTHFGATYEQASGVLVQADGKIVVSGTSFGSPNQVAIARYNDDGSLDTSFSGDGKLTNTNTTWGYRVAVAAGPGGKLLVSGISNMDFAVLRYNADGTVDTSFGGGDGLATADLGGIDYAYTLFVQADGKVVAAGTSLQPDNKYDFAVARFLADGTLDTTFSGDGWRIDDFGGVNSYGYDVAVGNDGRIVIAGKAGTDFAVAAYDGGKERLYAQHDANFNVTAVTDAYGVVKERYLYDPYGAVTYKTVAWGPQSSSNYSWLYLHQGGRYDGSNKLYHFRNRDYSPSLGRWIAMDPLGYVDGANAYEATSSRPTSTRDPLGLWDEAGHFWMTYMVAVAAGKDREEAYELAYWSQYPDQVDYLNAASLWKMRIGAQIHNPGTAEAERLKAAHEQWTKDVFDQLHQLHGGGQQQVWHRRQCLTKLLTTGNLKTWEKGFVIHALGDSYSHTYKDKSGAERAYGWSDGHLLDGHAPDKIGLRPHLASSYAHNLYLALGGSADPTREQWNQMGQIYGNIGSDNAQFQISWFSNLARSGFGFGDFSPYVPNPLFARREPSRAEVVDLIGRMKKACGCASYNK